MKTLIAAITVAPAIACLALGDTPAPKLGDDFDKTRASISGIAEVEKLDAEHMKIKGFNAARYAAVEFIMENGVQVAQIWHDEFTDYELAAFFTQYGALENWLFSATTGTPTYSNPTAAVFIIIGNDKTLTVCTHEAAKYLGLEGSSPLVFIEDFVKALASNDLDTQLRYYADRVDYYEFGQVTKETIRKDLKHDITAWPNRIYLMAGTPKITRNAK